MRDFSVFQHVCIAVAFSMFMYVFLTGLRCLSR